LKNIWQVQDAKSKFSELVDQALANGVQIITRRGKKTAALLPYDDYVQLTKQQGNLAEFLLASPLSGAKVNVKRDKSLPRIIDLEP
jgi:antitoxin Phd